MSKFQKARILMMIVKQGQGIISAHARFITSFLCFPFFNIFVSLNLSLLFCYYILFIFFYPYCCHSLQPISALTKQKSEVTLPILQVQGQAIPATICHSSSLPVCFQISFSSFFLAEAYSPQQKDSHDGSLLHLCLHLCAAMAALLHEGGGNQTETCKNWFPGGCQLQLCKAQC